MARTYDADIRILGGLPITVEYTVAPADRDVGIMSDYVEEWCITHINDRKCKTEPLWLTKRIAACKGEEERILTAINEYVDDRIGDDE
jgi:hypothetical protein